MSEDGVVILSEGDKKTIVQYLKRVKDGKWEMKEAEDMFPKAKVFSLDAKYEGKKRFVVLKYPQEDPSDPDCTKEYAFMDIPFSKMAIFYDMKNDYIYFARRSRHVVNKANRLEVSMQSFQTLSITESLAYGIKYAYEHLSMVCHEGTSLTDAAKCLVDYNNRIVAKIVDDETCDDIPVISPYINSSDIILKYPITRKYFSDEFITKHHIPDENAASSSSSKSKASKKANGTSAKKQKTAKSSSSSTTSKEDREIDIFDELNELEEVESVWGFPEENKLDTFVSKPPYEQLLDTLITQYPQKIDLVSSKMSSEEEKQFKASDAIMKDSRIHSIIWKALGDVPAKMTVDEWMCYLVSESARNPTIQQYVNAIEEAIERKPVDQISDQNKLFKGKHFKHTISSLKTAYVGEDVHKYTLGYILLTFRLKKYFERFITCNQETVANIKKLREEEAKKWKEDKETIKSLKAKLEEQEASMINTEALLNSQSETISRLKKQLAGSKKKKSDTPSKVDEEEEKEEEEEDGASTSDEKDVVLVNSSSFDTTRPDTPNIKGNTNNDDDFDI